MRPPIALVFIVVCCLFGGLVAFRTRSLVSVDEKPQTISPKTAVEVWTDPETGHRFAIARHLFGSGVGICLIPEREEENDCPEPALAKKEILESISQWPERN